MARTHIVKSAQKAQGNCMSPDCSHESREITVGMSYKHFSIRSHKGGRGTKKVYHVNCHVPQSHRTTSAQLGTIYDAQETASKTLSSIAAEDASADFFREVAADAAQGIREAGEMYTESADNMESGFGTSTYVSDEIREKGEGCENWADEIESAGDDIEDFDEDGARQDAEGEVEDDDDLTDEEKASAVEESIESKRQDWFDEAVSTIEDALQNQPF